MGGVPLGTNKKKLMKIVNGNLWDTKDDVLLVTTNATVKKNGELVMGRGAAKEAKERFPILPSILGDQITRYFSETKKYGVLILSPYALVSDTHVYGKSIGAFQVKYNWWERADLELIEFSIDTLVSILKREKSFHESRVSMNFPGIGNGGLSYEDVLPIVSRLPDRVTLYTKGSLNGSN